MAGGHEHDLQLREHEGLQRREWLVERIAWALFALILLAAACGLFGGGPLSRATGASGGVTVEYERFARRQRAVELVIRLDRAASDSVMVELSGRYLAGSHLEHVSPSPTREIGAAESGRFVFATTAGEPAELKFRLTPVGVGERPGSVSVNGASVPISMFVYP